MATKAKTASVAKKTTSKDKIAFLERQCEQLGKERNQFAIQNQELAAACELLNVEVKNISKEYNRLLEENVRLHNKSIDLEHQLAKSSNTSRHWVLRKLGL